MLEPLAEQWQKGGYDIRWLFRTILNTEAYQRRVRSTANAAGKTPFASSCPSRLRADQVFDALVQALALPAGFQRQSRSARETTERPGQARARNSRVSRAIQTPATGSTKKGAAKAAEAAGLASQVGKKAAAAMRRAARRLLFDRLFGVDPSVANEDVMGTIPQALFLMNGPMVNNRTQARPGTVLGEILTHGPQRPRRPERPLPPRAVSPAHDQGSRNLRPISGGRRQPGEAFEDIYWSLINSTEFLTRR